MRLITCKLFSFFLYLCFCAVNSRKFVVVVAAAVMIVSEAIGIKGVFKDRLSLLDFL